MHFVVGQGGQHNAFGLAQFIRLVVCAQENSIVEQPSIVATHFLPKR